MTALRCDPVNPPPLGRMRWREDVVRRGFDKIEERSGLAWLAEHLDYTTRPLLSEPWILDIDTTVKPLHGHQQGVVVSYNPHMPGPAVAQLSQLAEQLTALERWYRILSQALKNISAAEYSSRRDSSIGGL